MSRPQACAERLGEHAADTHRFADKHVLLTGEVEILSGPNGRWLLEDALRLLVRTCRNVSVWLPTQCEQLRKEAQRLAREIEFANPVHVLEVKPAFDGFHAVLSIGSSLPGANGTVINSNGWIARVSSAQDIAKGNHLANPIGALAAASLGVAEVFKRLVCVRPERGPYAERVSLSLFTLKDGDEPGPPLPPLKFRALLAAGQGAIGNGITLLLGQLKPTGSILLLDRQDYGAENLGTCVLLSPNGVGKSKVETNAAWLKAQAVSDVQVLHADVESIRRRCGQDLPWPSIVLAGLDNIEARHDLQELWPDLLIDGAIGDFACQSATFVWGDGGACMKCLFTLPSGTDPLKAASDATGLSVDRINDAESVVTEQDVYSAPSEKKESLRRDLGRRICSVVSDAMLAKISADAGSDTFSPSVPFVATMSAALILAACMRHFMGLPPTPARYYIDLLVGPETAETFNERARPGCYCTVRSSIISRYRQSMAA